jgi:2-polyprenyl-3-methyl-5-hydroxy-6-metoxy-1,4-benzoquinol methylase
MAEHLGFNSDPTRPDPTRPHDRLTLEELAGSYNFANTSHRAVVFCRVVIEHARGLGGPVRALDIGCGEGLGRKPAQTGWIKEAVDELWGIEPDASITPPEGMFDHFQHALMETAELPEGHFDIAYAYLVMEHVADPEGFFRAVHRALRPGGVFLFLTVNSSHYFTRIARAMHAARIDEKLLRLLRGRTLTDAYHYEVQYKCNSRQAIERVARTTGFETPLIAFIEDHGPRGYLPGPLSVVYHAMNVKRRLVRRPEALLTVIARLRKPW